MTEEHSVSPLAFETRLISLYSSGSNMTDSGSFIKVPTSEEEERMRKAADEARRKREESRKKVEMDEAMKKAGGEAQNRRRGEGEGGSGAVAQN
ncbi:unnamed protein product [Clonostachys rosea f. rosea IK726]|uniref:Uncharacterized protein n=1 Tax=Clonostachys rosea f. rosea IK726 TaxID=1349383 RepID=A0ACA9UTU6_BIOOC|nr:unnamed protein product [Clonostachys rosea f. rosea IK726]